MKELLLDLEGQEANTLYFIGNGFDLFHNLKTQYSDFRKWLIRYKYADFVSTMEKIFPELQNGQPLLWKDFEQALECADPMKVHRDFFQGRDDGFYDEKVQNRVAERLKIHLVKIPVLLRLWLESIPLNDVPQLLDLSTESLYLSFNYTLLLEKIYYIPESRILHIHNSIQIEKPLITGHGLSYSENGIVDDNINIGISTQIIAIELNKLRKPVYNIIENNSMFFDSLRDINHVVVFGHSLSRIDRLYFTEVIRRVKDNTKWYFVVYNEEAEANVKKLLHEYNDSKGRYLGGNPYKNKIIIENCKFIQVNNNLSLHL